MLQQDIDAACNRWPDGGKRWPLIDPFDPKGIRAKEALRKKRRFGNRLETKKPRNIQATNAMAKIQPRNVISTNKPKRKNVTIFDKLPRNFDETYTPEKFSWTKTIVPFIVLNALAIAAIYIIWNNLELFEIAK